MINHHPIEQSKRTAIIDILRGWAILGVVLGNYSNFIFIGLPSKINSNLVSDILQIINRYFFASKSWTLLTVLFGYGFAILINSIARKGKNPVSFFSWRMILLFILAFINSSFWFGDILKDYAFLGLVLLLFYKSSTKTLAIICSILFISIPFLMAYINELHFERFKITTSPEYLKLYYSGNWLDFLKFNFHAAFHKQIIAPGYVITGHVVMLLCMLFGLLLQKIDFFVDLDKKTKLLKRTLFISLFSAVTIEILLAIAINQKAEFLKFFHPFYWQILSTMIFIATGILLLYINSKLKRIFSYFQVAGKMTLTNYISQNILATFIFSGIGLGIGNSMPYWFYFSLAVFVFMIQLFISKWWLSKYSYGPIEWLWRCASYRQLFPLKKPIQNNAIKEKNTKRAE